jgi:multidrug transporter EmrE-like cation transporter
MGYIYIFLTILLTVYGQVVLKWRMNLVGVLPEGIFDKLFHLLKLIFDPYIFSSFFAAFLASLAWMAALTKFEISYAYPFMSLSFILVLMFSYIFLHEPLTLAKILGITLIMVGLGIASR